MLSSALEQKLVRGSATIETSRSLFEVADMRLEVGGDGRRVFVADDLLTERRQDD